MAETVGEGARWSAAAPETAPAATAERPSVAHLLELGLLRTSWQLLREHWWQLAIVGLCAFALHAGAQQLALAAFHLGTLPAYLAFCLVPLVPLGAAVAGLLVLRRHTDRSGMGAVLAALGSVLVPFLVVYESQGQFTEDLSDFLYGGFTLWSEAQYAVSESGEPVPNNIEIVLETGAPLVLVTFVVAFLLRVVGARLVERESWWRDGRRRRLRAALRVLIGYAEVVWIVIGAAVINTGLKGLLSWWSSVRVGDALGDWWTGVGIDLPHLDAAVEGIITIIGLLLDGVVSGLIAPLAWVAIGVVIYGRAAADTLSQDELTASIERRNRLASVARRVNPAVVRLAWTRVTSSEGRFGALLGGAAMVLRSRYLPLLVFCLVYTLVATWVPYLVWELAVLALGSQPEYADWLALYGPLNAVAYVIGLCVTMPLIAAYSDSLLTRFGAPSQLRLSHGTRPATPVVSEPAAVAPGAREH